MCVSEQSEEKFARAINSQPEAYNKHIYMFIIPRYFPNDKSNSPALQPPKPAARGTNEFQLSF